MAARRKTKKTKKPKKRARAGKARKRPTVSRARALKAPARAAVPKRVTELEAENRRLREENAALRAQLNERPTPSVEPETEPLPLD